MAKDKDGIVNELGLEGGHQDFDFLRKDSSQILGKDGTEASKLKIVGLASAIVFGLILIFLMFGARGNKEQVQRVKEPSEIESKVKEVEDLRQKVEALEKKLEESNRSIQELSQALSSLKKEVGVIKTQEVLKAQEPKKELKPQVQAQAPPKEAPKEAPKAAQGVLKTHVVQKGETLILIAKKYNLDPKELMRINNIKDPNTIKVGQRLKLSP
jgi:LysM repeat protein